MDTFIDKLAQKFTPSEMIKANTAAEAKENKVLREKVENYENLLQEMKLVNTQNMQSAKEITKMLEECGANGKNADVEALFDKTNDTIHTENVKVYRNVQAAVNEGLEEQTKAILEAQNLASKKSSRFMNVMSVVLLVAVLADIALQVLRILGIL